MTETEGDCRSNRRQSQTKQDNQSSTNKPREQPGKGREAKAGGTEKISSTGTGTAGSSIKMTTETEGDNSSNRRPSQGNSKAEEDVIKPPEPITEGGERNKGKMTEKMGSG